MKFLIDQQLPRRLADWIRLQGHHAEHVRELGLEHAQDRDVWREASTRGAVIVTKDDDFSVIVRAEAGPQVLWLRFGNCSNDVLLERIAELWPTLVTELEAGTPFLEIR